ncbi:hypothetical protein BDK51DRAFT_36556 [Blyttiomyces helicus]|uniref:Uncharacterized protein n=1 Tax=Blyttiomyces helicus TaxID=388810 RepID=A0A4P9W602_9FUNG|nr:hypothetical protein BDK51DRAFT_36556 [Blyttiomyces helicus]|eukprot:RKO85536.1 hypothetical protein BDK51DRAFT_36556 [Blyttiomyces helicus]
MTMDAAGHPANSTAPHDLAASIPADHLLPIIPVIEEPAEVGVSRGIRDDEAEHEADVDEELADDHDDNGDGRENFKGGVSLCRYGSRIGGQKDRHRVASPTSKSRDDCHPRTNGDPKVRSDAGLGYLRLPHVVNPAPDNAARGEDETRPLPNRERFLKTPEDHGVVLRSEIATPALVRLKGRDCSPPMARTFHSWDLGKINQQYGMALKGGEVPGSIGLSQNSGMQEGRNQYVAVTDPNQFASSDVLRINPARPTTPVHLDSIPACISQRQPESLESISDTGRGVASSQLWSVGPESRTTIEDPGFDCKTIVIPN